MRICFPRCLFGGLLLFSLPGHCSNWTTDSFEEFAQGTYADGGTNLYVSSKGRLQMVNRWDLNGDGFLDIVIPSGHSHTEKEDAFLYLNNGEGEIEGRSLIKVPTNGGVDGAFADLNKDGLTDLALCNQDNGVTYQTDTYVYYGNQSGYSADHRTVLPSVRAAALLASDFDGDSWVDLFVANEWQEDYLNNKGTPTSFVFWNDNGGFDPKRRTDIGGSVRACAAGDFDSDSVDDLLVSVDGKTQVLTFRGQGSRPAPARTDLSTSGEALAIGDINKDARKDLAVSAGSEVRIYVGSGSGLGSEAAFSLPAKQARDVILADLNQDGFDDLAVANYASADGATWVHSSVFLSEAGKFQEKPSFELSTVAASGLSAVDLNKDSYPELIVSNERVTNQASILSAVYWNRQGSFRDGDQTFLDTQGAVANAVGDANNDGWLDVVFFNREGNFRDGASRTFIYWGDGTRNYTSARRKSLLTHYMGGGASADLDDDGYVDLILLQGRFISGAREDLFSRVIILWGGPEPFERKTNLSMDHDGSGVGVLDLNRDGYLDLIVGGDAKNAQGETGAVVFWGSPRGFSQDHRLIIPVSHGSLYRAPLAADLDRDGHLDLAVQSEKGRMEIYRGDGGTTFVHDPAAQLDFGTEDLFGFLTPADLNKDGFTDLLFPVRNQGRRTDTPSYVLYGSSKGFSTDHSERLATYACTDPSIADLNKDSWLDIVTPSYKDNFKRDVPASIYWGSKEGFHTKAATRLPSHSSNGAEIADFDGDSWLDILLINHCADGSTTVPGPQNHLTSSYIYWGSEAGFDGVHRTELEGLGPHAFNARDVGNSMDRSLYDDYLSPAYPIPSGESPKRLEWIAETPMGTSIVFQSRTARSKEALMEADWRGPAGGDSWYTENPSPLASGDGQWIQYRARLSTPNGGPTAVLKSVSLVFN